MCACGSCQVGVHLDAASALSASFFLGTNIVTVLGTFPPPGESTWPSRKPEAEKLEKNVFLYCGKCVFIVFLEGVISK